MTMIINHGVADTNSYKLEDKKSHLKEKKDMKEYRAEIVMTVNFKTSDKTIEEHTSMFGGDKTEALKHLAIQNLSYGQDTYPRGFNFMGVSGYW